jgi:predicted DNA-binding transcriptional regulator AlpA
VTTRNRVTADPVGLVEIATRLGRSRGVVDVWRHRGLLPEPRWIVGGRPAWDWSDITAWCQATGRSALLEVNAAELIAGAE